MNYWDRISESYPTHYSDKWSLLENNFIKDHICKTIGSEFKNVLDLGCGNGLGYEICSSINSEIDYVGIDISQKMLEHLKDRYPKANTKNLKMSNLSDLENNSFDFVLSIFTAFSYTDNVEKTLDEIYRVLKPNGKILISVISKYSLRRLLKFKFGQMEKYKTRGINSDSFSYSWVFSNREISKKLNSNFTHIKTDGYNVFGGIPICTRYPRLWKLNLSLSSFLPNLSHELLITGIKKS